jgi:hypothetical protein
MQLLAAISQRNRYAKAVAALSPTAWWRLAETSGTVAKAVMGSHDGTIVNGFTAAAGAIAGNGAMTFNGTTQRIAIGDVLDSVFAGENKSFSICAWVNLATADASTRVIVAKLGDSPENQREFFLGQLSGKIRYVWYGALDATSYRVMESTATLITATWYHVATTFDHTQAADDKAKIYINGTAGQSVALTAGTPANIIAGTAKLSIASSLLSDNTTAKYFLSGTVDEISIHPAALTAAQVLALYQSR